MWRRRRDPGRPTGTTQIVIRRVARRSVFGAMTISGIDLTANAQVRLTQLRTKWERVL